MSRPLARVRYRVCAWCLAAAFLLASAPTVGTAQSFNLAAVVGALQYDAGGDKAYFTFGIQARYFVTPAFRIGIMGSTAHIGELQRDWIAPGSDVQFWRIGVMAELAATPVKKAAVSVRGLLGVNHVSGLTYLGRPPDFPEEFWGITDSPTGISYGGGLGLEVGPFSQVRFLLQANIWMDNAFGGSGFDPELLFGVGVDL